MFAEKSLAIVRNAIERHFGGNVRAAALSFGVNAHTLRRWLLGERVPSLVEIGKALDYIGAMVLEPDENLEAFELVSKVEARAGAGSSLVTSEDVEDVYAFRRDFLRNASINAKQAIMMDVMGTSMEPLIRDKDTILVDQSATDLRDGEIFLVGFGDDLLVKRLQRTPKGWLLRSENRDFSDITVEGEDMDQFRVYGRVRWFGRVL